MLFYLQYEKKNRRIILKIMDIFHKLDALNLSHTCISSNHKHTDMILINEHYVKNGAKVPANKYEKRYKFLKLI